MALACHRLARTGSRAKSFSRNYLRYNRDVTDSHHTKHSPIALDLCRWPQRLGKIVGKLYRRTAFYTRNLADQADGVEATATARIATAEVVCKQRAPTCAESNAPARSPLAPVVKIFCAAEIRRSDSACQRASEISMQPQNVINIQSVGCD